jgi:hypothetical protein
MLLSCAVLFFVSSVVLLARANTEIVNFSGAEATDGTSIPLLAEQWLAWPHPSRGK